MDLYNKNDFDYEVNKGTVYSIEDYKRMLKQEINLLKQNDSNWNRDGLKTGIQKLMFDYYEFINKII